MDAASPTPQASGAAVVHDPTGLHARPAVKLTRLAKRFAASVRVRTGDGAWVDAKSPNRVMKLKARHGETVSFAAEGPDAKEAVLALVALVESDFEGGGEVVLEGLPAAPGLAIGRIALQRAGGTATRSGGAPAEERSALLAAMTRAQAQLEALAAPAEPLAAEILHFQIALLDDDDLRAPILQRIAAGEAADRAWAAVLDGEIESYREGGDATVAARAADLADLRDRVLDALAPATPAARGSDAEGAILAAPDLTPSRFLETDWTRHRGAALAGGSAAGHVALLARARGTPLVVGLGPAFGRLRDGAAAILDGDRGRLILDPEPATLVASEARLAEQGRRAAAELLVLDQPALTAEGAPVLVLINVDDPTLLDRLDPRYCDGIGLVRTEFLFQAGELPGEERQLAAYLEVLRWAAGRPVIIRTLDAGGDKPIAGLTPVGEANPFLGLRGLRLSLARPEVLRVQLRALARAAAEGPLEVMAPMVTVPGELDALRRLFEDVVAELHAAGVAAALPSLGMMVEVPAAALDIASFDAEFYSIGSNDLIQYLTAASRDDPAVAKLHDPRHPAVLELILRVVDAGRATGRPVSLCGEMASDPALVPLLLAAGLRRLSVAPAAIGRVKAAIATWRENHERQGEAGP